MNGFTIKIESSAKHVHLNKEDVEALFGKGYVLTNKRDLSQPGEFLSNERVALEGSKGKLENVAVLGPERKATQVELSFTDARALGLTVPVRESGDVEGSSPVTIIGPEGRLDLTEGAIAAKRHVHFVTADAEAHGIKNKDIIKVKVKGERAVIFDEVVARVSDNFATYMHIDYDETNAAGITGEAEGTVILKDWGKGHGGA